MSPTILSADAATITTGYWSGRKVLVNVSPHPIWIEGDTLQDLANFLDLKTHEYYDSYLCSLSEKLATVDYSTAKPNAIQNILKAHTLTSSMFESYALEHGCIYRNNGVGYKALNEHLNSLSKTVELKPLFLHLLKYQKSINVYAMLTRHFGGRIDSPAVMLRIDWKSWLAKFSTPHDLLTEMLLISGARNELTLSKGKERLSSLDEGEAILYAELSERIERIPVTDPKFKIKLGDAPSNTVISIRTVVSAIQWALLTLCRKGKLLLPVTFCNLKSSDLLMSLPDWSSIAEHFAVSVRSGRTLYFRIIQSSQVSGIQDMSVEICRLFIGSSRLMAGSAIKGLTASVNRYEIVNTGKPRFPIHEINIRRQISKKTDIETFWSSEHLRASGFTSWAVAAEIYYKLHPSATDAISSTVGRLVTWSQEVGLTSPWDVVTINLIDPSNPDSPSLYNHLCRANPNRDFGRRLWTLAAQFYTIVVNALKPLPEYQHLDIQNPFVGLTNPFRGRSNSRLKIGKTFRRLIPSDHLAAMLDTLIEPDAQGHPTFGWARKKFLGDVTERFNHKEQSHDIVWHPSRAICLAVLLLVPLRGKQARWLDQGLMDQHRWNIDDDTWKKNDHKLQDYCYPDGSSHQDRYGRDSGVLQPVASILGGNSGYIGLYVNTNKTQLWNPDDRTGYDIPWPDGKELLCSEDPRVRKQGQHLGLVYSLIRQQIRWMETYDPNPIPVDFSNDGENYNQFISSRFPKFCPIFRDLISPTSNASGQTVFVPVSKQKLEALFHALAEETERRLIEQGFPKESIGLTVKASNTQSMVKLGRPRFIIKCAYDVHSLRVAGITHLLEMGVPAHIVSEFIAGHMALVMTLHYAKFQPLKLRQKILDAFQEADAIDQFESVLSKSGISGVNSLLVRNRHYAETEAPDISDLLSNRGLWRYINGGICPGASCDEGGAMLVRKESIKANEYITAPVPGGPESCGNCRFFLTSPAFVVPQMLVANSLMLKMRELGRLRKKLWDDKASVEITLFESDEKKRTLTSKELVAINGELERIDRALEPLILEWCNRYEMFQSSLGMADEWDKRTGKTSLNPLVLFGSDPQLSLSATLDPKGCEYSLVKQIVMQSEMLGGRRVATELADHKLREFVDRILVQEDVRNLLLTIHDSNKRRRAALMMAEAMSMFAGGDHAVQAALDSNTPLKTTPQQHEYLCSLARMVTASGTTLNGDSFAMENLLLEVGDES